MSRSLLFPGCPVADDARWYPAEEAGSVGGVRRAATELGQCLGLPEDRVGSLAILATELTSNLHKHAREGSVLVRALRLGQSAAVELVAVDAGPGMADPVAALRDGHSTTGTLGIGLSAIERHSTSCDVYSLPGVGTVTAAEVWSDGVSQPAWAQGVCRPMAGERVCGDGFAIRSLGERGQVMVCDGLGHGPLAEAAARAAIRAFGSAPEDAPRAVLDQVNRGLGGTRGAAVMVVELDPVAGVVRAAGLGNIAGFVVTPGHRRQLVSLPGIAGHRQRSATREFVYDLPAGATVVLHSDGVTDRWVLDDYPGLLDRKPAVTATALLRAAGVRRDDASVLVARVPS